MGEPAASGTAASGAATSDLGRFDLAIVGRGCIAAVALSVRRARPDEGPVSTVAMIGEEDPWPLYADHQMGQWPCLLSMPGFARANQHHHEKPDAWLSSTRFAIATGRQFKTLAGGDLALTPVPGVLGTSAIDFADGLFTVRGESQTGQWVLTANKLDICAGPGGPRLLDPKNSKGPFVRSKELRFDPDLLAEYRGRSTTARILVAQDYMRGDRTPEGVVCVAGEGPLAAGCVERALASSRCTAVVWVAREHGFFIPFPASDRYANLFSQWGQAREGLADAKATLAFGLISDVSVEPTEKLALALRGEVGASSPVWLGQPHSVFDQLVISASSVNGRTEGGSTAALLSKFRMADPARPHDNDLTDLHRQGVFCGFEGAGGRLRVLGGSAFALLGAESTWLTKRTGGRVTAEWHRTLPGQARFPSRDDRGPGMIGLTTAAALVARAGGYYSASEPDACVNTCMDFEPGFSNHSPRGDSPSPDALGVDSHPRPA